HRRHPGRGAPRLWGPGGVLAAGPAAAGPGGPEERRRGTRRPGGLVVPGRGLDGGAERPALAAVAAAGPEPVLLGQRRGRRPRAAARLPGPGPQGRRLAGLLPLVVRPAEPAPHHEGAEYPDARPLVQRVRPQDRRAA